MHSTFAAGEDEAGVAAVLGELRTGVGAFLLPSFFGIWLSLDLRGLAAAAPPAVSGRVLRSTVCLLRAAGLVVACAFEEDALPEAAVVFGSKSISNRPAFLTGFFVALRTLAVSDPSGLPCPPLNQVCRF